MTPRRIGIAVINVFCWCFSWFLRAVVLVVLVCLFPLLMWAGRRAHERGMGE